MNLLQRFGEHIRRENLFTPDDQFLLAVSGGLDSAVLCELCHQSGFTFRIAHCNFQLRGEESDRDEEFVKKLGEKYKADVEVKRFETEKYATDNKLSVQEAARILRYDWFDELVRTLSQNLTEGRNRKSKTTVRPLPTADSRLQTLLLTAHHADDNNETVLMNFFRGTGLHGLTGMPAKSGFIRRPLLPFSREELMEFAKEQGLGFVEDSSNLSNKYTRNYFRNEIIPAIAKVYPQVSANLQDNIRRFTETENLYQVAVDAILQKLCKKKGKEVHVPVKQLMGYRSRALIYALIAPYGFTEKQVEELVKLAGSGSGHYITAPDASHRIIRHRHWFIITGAGTEESMNIIIEEGEKEIIFPGGRLRIHHSRKPKPGTDNKSVMLDRKGIVFPLLLRKWKTGDYFYPLGMKKKKKIARFLIDNKLSVPQKENVWVLESAQRIIWVLGLRIDDRFRITEQTSDALYLDLS